MCIDVLIYMKPLQKFTMDQITTEASNIFISDYKVIKLKINSICLKSNKYFVSDRKMK